MTTSTKRDYYETLGVARGAGDKEIKSAYRKIAVKHHPDRNPGDRQAEELFKEAAEAYAVLSDVDKRQRYDRFGHQGVSGAGGFDPSTFSDFSDVLGDLFGFGDLFGGRRRGGPTVVAGADLRYDLRISFEDAAFGAEPTLRIPRLETCDECSGTGSEGGGPPARCETCGGRGQVRFSQGLFTVARTCPECRGAGTRITDPCLICRGEGRTEQEHSLKVRIPPGVDTGARLRLSGEGEHGPRGGPPGDLYVVLHVDEHERLVRSGHDVLSRVEIGYPQAVLGTKVEIETLHGVEPLDIPSGTAPGQQFRLRGHGFPHLGRTTRGDHVIEIALAVPSAKNLEEEELELLKRLAELRDQPVRERKVLDRVKDLFG